MTSSHCPSSLSLAELAEYWLDEQNPAAGLAIEEHLMSCGVCSEKLQKLVSLAAGIRLLARRGAVFSVFPRGFVDSLRQTDLRIREYRLEPQGSVNCTIAPDDDWVVAHLSAPLEGVRKLDLVFEDLTAGVRGRVSDVAFNAGDGEIVIAPGTDALRKVDTAIHRVQLIAVEPGPERMLGEYTFNHSRYQGE